MNKLNSILTLALSFLLLACSKPTIEIVEQNNSYTLDPKVTDVFMPDKLGFNPSNLIRLTSSIVEINAQIDIRNREQGLELDAEQIVLNLELKKPLKTASKVLIQENRELLKEYAGDKAGKLAFPNGVITTTEFIIPAGVTSHQVNLDMADLTELSDLSGYLTAYSLILEPGEGEEEVLLTKSSQSLFISLAITEYDSKPEVPELTIKFSGESRKTTARISKRGNATTIAPREITLEIELSQASPVAIDIAVEFDANIPNSYTDSDRSNTPLPGWVIATKNHQIPANTTKHSITVRLSARNGSTYLPRTDYIGILRLRPYSHEDKVTIDPAEDNYRVVVVTP